MPTKLSKHQLNRTLLHRQFLRERHDMPIIEIVDALVGLQSQIHNPPYIGLWTRLKNFQRGDLTQLIDKRKIVRAAMMRSTLHLVTEKMHQTLRMTLQPALERAFRAFFGKDGKALDAEYLAQAAKSFLTDNPSTTGELRDFLLTVNPNGEPIAMAYAVRTYLPLVQVPPSGTWGTGTRATYVPAETWLGEAHAPDLKTMLALYLRAFGPASVMDFQAWSGLVSLKKTVEAFRDDFVFYEDENGKELWDVPELPIVEADTPAPIRFIPDYDNLLVSHKDRNRIIADDDRQYVFLSAARVLGTILVDGFVSGTWKTQRDKSKASLQITMFDTVKNHPKDEIAAEGERLLHFIEDDAESYDVQFL